MYLRISASASARAKAKSVIDTLEKAVVYSKLDGNTTQVQIEADTKVPQSTISAWVREFVRAGLASPPTVFYNSHKALFSLDELDISLESLGGMKKRRGRAVPGEGAIPTQSQETIESVKEKVQKGGLEDVSR